MGTGDYRAQLNLDIRIKRTFLVYSWVSKYLLEMDLILSSVVNKIQGLNIQYNGPGILTASPVQSRTCPFGEDLDSTLRDCSSMQPNVLLDSQEVRCNSVVRGKEE